MLKVSKIVIIQLHASCIWKFHMPYDESKQTEMVRRPGQGQGATAIPWQLPLRPSATHASWCPLSGVKFSDVGRTLWTFLLLSWNQIRFQTKLIKSRALKLTTTTLGIPWHCCEVLKPQCEEKANASVSRRKGSVFFSGSRPQITLLKILME